MGLTSTQVGVIGENLLINEIMKASEGRLAPFQPMADDDGLDVLFYDKITGNSVAVQLKCRRAALKSARTKKPGNTIHFEVRKATLKEARQAYLVGALFNPEITEFLATWLVPLDQLQKIARSTPTKFVIRPSKSEESQDRFVSFRCSNIVELARRIIDLCEAKEGAKSKA
ncbi:hypothetical protein [Dongia sp.]|uniref:hypothetical protein n=1 Tax=Dongia sp. TaxID=1977262 RepID=UPI0037539DDC